MTAARVSRAPSVLPIDNACQFIRYWSATLREWARPCLFAPFRRFCHRADSDDALCDCVGSLFWGRAHGRASFRRFCPSRASAVDDSWGLIRARANANASTNVEDVDPPAAAARALESRRRSHSEGVSSIAQSVHRRPRVWKVAPCAVHGAHTRRASNAQYSIQCPLTICAVRMRRRGNRTSIQFHTDLRVRARVCVRVRLPSLILDSRASSRPPRAPPRRRRRRSLLDALLLLITESTQ